MFNFKEQIYNGVISNVTANLLEKFVEDLFMSIKFYKEACYFWKKVNQEPNA